MTIKDLKKKILKSKKDEVLITWYTTRKISPYITYSLLKFPITPNMITTFMILLNIIALVIHYFNPFLGIILIQISYTLDCVDGEIARAKNMKSKLGHYLDELGHFLTIPTLYMVIALRVFHNSSNAIYIVFGILMMISTYLRISHIPAQITPIDKQKKIGEIKKTFLGGQFKITDLLHNYVYLLFGLTFVYILYPFSKDLVLSLEKIFIYIYTAIFTLELPLLIYRDIKIVRKD